MTPWQTHSAVQLKCSIINPTVKAALKRSLGTIKVGLDFHLATSNSDKSSKRCPTLHAYVRLQLGQIPMFAQSARSFSCLWMLLMIMTMIYF
jgi:hypothetical protein